MASIPFYSPQKLLEYNWSNILWAGENDPKNTNGESLKVSDFNGTGLVYDSAVFSLKYWKCAVADSIYEPSES